MFKVGDAVSVDGYSGVAWRIVDIEKEYIPIMYREWDPDSGEWYDAESDEFDEVDGERWECWMVGDDRPFFFEPSELTAISDDDFCGGCGQLGCGHG